MKAIFDGLRYDTTTADLIGGYDNLCEGASSTSDFGYWEATLYRTPRAKRYFLAGEGGPMTRFSRPAGGNSTSGGSKIIPMDAQEALDWATRYLAPEIVEEFFPDQIEDA